MIRKIIELVILLLIIVSCSERVPMTIIPNDDILQLYDYYVDEYGNEGVVVHIDSSSMRSIAFVLSADEASCIWGPSGFIVFNDDTEIIEDNIEHPRFSLIMSRYISMLGVERFPAFNWCLSKNNGTPLAADSWILPSHHEMSTFLKNIDLDKLNQSLLDIGGTPLISDVYWTSTEDFPGIVKLKDEESDYNPENWAICITPSHTYYVKKHIWWHKNRKLGVRAIKYIEYEGKYDVKL